MSDKIVCRLGEPWGVDLVPTTPVVAPDSREANNFFGGVWYKYQTTGPAKVRLSWLAGPNAVLTAVGGY